MSRILLFADYVSRMSGSFEKHDLPVRTRYLPNVRRPDVGVSDMSQGSGQAYTTLLKLEGLSQLVAYKLAVILRE